MSSDWITTVTVEQQSLDVPECDVFVKDEPLDCSRDPLAEICPVEMICESKPITNSPQSGVKDEAPAPIEEPSEIAPEVWPFADPIAPVPPDSPPTPPPEPRAYVCEVCKKQFKRISTLNLHKAVHSNERPFQCEICYKTFKRKATLHSHMNVHDPSQQDEYNFKCVICKKKFGINRRNNLRFCACAR